MFLHANARKWDMHILKQNFLMQTVRMRIRHLDGGPTSEIHPVADAMRSSHVNSS